MWAEASSHSDHFLVLVEEAESYHHDILRHVSSLKSHLSVRNTGDMKSMLRWISACCHRSELHSSACVSALLLFVVQFRDALIEQQLAAGGHV